VKYDTVIVGAGSAGSIVAARLSEDPDHSVLLLEAGPDYPDFEHLPDEVKFGYATATDIMTSDHNWQFLGKASDTAPPMLVPRGRVTGGSSAINGQVFLRGVPEDYDSWAAMGNDEWAFPNLIQYFRKVEADPDFPDDDFHSSEGAIIVRRFKPDEMRPDQTAFYEACREAGFADSPDHNAPDASGVGPVPMNNPNGIRFSTALGYLNPARHRLNLTIRPNCVTRKIIFEGKRAVGVEVESGGERFTVDAGEVILSSGAIGSPHIMLLSGVGPADNLGEIGIPVIHELPGVGQNLRDHPMVFTTWQTKPDYPLDGFAPRVQTILRWTAEGSDVRNDLLIFMQSYATDRNYRGVGDVPPLGIRMLASLELQLSAGELRLTSSDPDEQPSLDYRYLQYDEDLRRMREAVRLCVSLGQHEKFTDIIESRIEPTDDELSSDEKLDAYMLREATTGQHISGTCKMGPGSDKMAVVDQYGRVHGMENLRIVDASMMPDCIRANTNLSTMMIAERVSDFIREGK